MRKMIVRIQADQSGTDKISLEYVDANIPGSDLTGDFVSHPVADAIVRMGQGVLTPQIVGEAGNWLYTKLASHQPIQLALGMALNQQLDDDCLIYFEIRSDKADELPWETLREPAGKFLALNRQWPIARIAAGPDTTPTYHFDWPIRIMAVLSVTGEDARPEWDALWSAIENAGMHVRLHVMLSQGTLKSHIDSLGNPNVTCSYITNHFDLAREAGKFQPNILHFFCHGATEPDPHLLLATKADWLNGRSSVQIRPADLASEGTLRLNNWLITLNCCQGAAPVAQAQNLARKLVTEGFPAVVGMREVVAITDAHIFCEGLYNLVLSELNQWANTPQEVEISWSRLLYEARGLLASEHNATQGLSLAAAATELKEWTLPVLYTKRQPFKIRGRSNNQSLTEDEKQKKQTTLNSLQQALDTLATIPGTPPEALNAISHQIALLRSELYPAAAPPLAPVLSPIPA
jgi:hypothetical protein